MGKPLSPSPGPVQRVALRPPGAPAILESRGAVETAPAPVLEPSPVAGAEVPPEPHVATPAERKRTERAIRRTKERFALLGGLASRAMADPDAIPDEALNEIELEARHFYLGAVDALGGPDALNPVQQILLTRILATLVIILRLDAEIITRTKEHTLVHAKTGLAHRVVQQREELNQSLARMMWRLGITGAHRRAMGKPSPKGLQEWLKMRQPIKRSEAGPNPLIGPQE